MDAFLSPSTALILALLLAAMALWVRYRARLAERRFPPGGRFIDIDGVRLHYLEQGSGPPVVLLHGNGSLGADFMACGLMAGLATRYRVIAFDRPGFGYSQRPRRGLWSPQRQADLLLQACAALGAARTIVVGHSWGSLVALAMARRDPAAVRGLVLISGYYFPTPRLDAWLLAAPAVPLLGDILRYTLSPLLGHLGMRRMLERIFEPDRVPRNFLERVPPSLMLRPWQIRAAAEEGALLVPAAMSLSRDYGRISQPVEIFAGGADRIVRQDRQAPRLQARLPHGELHLLPNLGHMLHYGASDRIERAVDRIARSTPRPIDLPATAGAPPLSPA